MLCSSWPNRSTSDNSQRAPISYVTQRSITKDHESTDPNNVSQATTWTLFAVAACFLAARLLIRLRIHGHLMIDDGLVILSMCMITAVCIIETVQVNTDLQVQAVQLGHHKPPPGFAARALTFSHFQWAIAYLWITGVWAVKGSFLAFYDGLTQRLLWYRRAWYVAIVLTILTYMGFLFCYAFLDGRQLKQGPRSEAIYYQFSVDIVTDVLSRSSPSPSKSLIPAKLTKAHFQSRAFP